MNWSTYRRTKWRPCVWFWSTKGKCLINQICSFMCWCELRYIFSAKLCEIYIAHTVGTQIWSCRIINVIFKHNWDKENNHFITTVVTNVFFFLEILNDWCLSGAKDWILCLPALFPLLCLSYEIIWSKLWLQFFPEELWRWISETPGKWVESQLWVQNCHRVSGSDQNSPAHTHTDGGYKRCSPLRCFPLLLLW